MEIATLPHAPLILLSGMGADERLFHYQNQAFPNLIVPSWIEPEPKDGLSVYAERLARSVDSGVPCLVGGASFGGIVALEMVSHLQAMRCFLIGSIRSPDQLPWQMRMFRPLSRLTPNQFAQLTFLCLGLEAVVARAGLSMVGPICGTERQLSALGNPGRIGVETPAVENDARVPYPR